MAPTTATFLSCLRAFLLASFCLWASAALAAPAKLERITKWSRFETTFRSSTVYDGPLDHTLRAELVSPIGETNLVACFWDGGRTWRLRFRPDLAGTWHFRTLFSDPANTGLHDREGSFLCTAVVSEDRFTRHGPIRRTPRGRTFQHRDGTPFLWVGDVSETGIRRASVEDWAFYSRIRARQRFTVAQWTLNNEPDERGERPFSDPAGRNPNPDFFRRFEQRIAASERAGLLNAIVLESGAFRDSRSTAALQRYAVARWSAFNTAWIIDAASAEANADFFDRFNSSPILLRHEDRTTNVPAWISGLALRTDAPALSGTNLYSHGLPIVLLLTNHENSLSGSRRIQATEVRREAWWNTLQQRAAGFTYTAAGVADWNETVEHNEEVAVWHKSLFLQGARQISVLSEFMLTAPRERFARPQTADGLTRGIAATQTAGKELGLFFSAIGGMMEVPLRLLPDLPTLTWFNPRTGATLRAVAAVGPETVKFSTPTPDDWLLIIEAEK